MLEKLKRVNGLTFVALMGALVALVFMVTHGWTPAQIAATAMGIATALAQLDKLVTPPPDAKKTDAPPPGAVLLPFAASLGVALITGACLSPQVKAAEAEAEFTHEQLRCVDAEPAPSRDAGVDDRRAAWARVDACRAAVRLRWGIADTQTAKGGGQ